MLKIKEQKSNTTCITSLQLFSEVCRVSMGNKLMAYMPPNGSGVEVIGYGYAFE